MSTQFFLRNAASDLGGAGQLSLATTRGAASTTAVTNTAASGTNVQVTKTAAGTALTWFSAPLNAITISGTVTVNIRGFESLGLANAGAGITIERTNAAGTVQSTIVANTGVPSTITEYGVGTDAAKNGTFTPTSTAIAATNRIKVTLFLKAAGGTMASGDTVTNSYDGPTSAAAGDSFVTFTETITAPTTWALAGTASNSTVQVPTPTFTHVGSHLFSNNAALPVNNQGLGNMLVVEVLNYTNSTVTCTGLTGGGATWAMVGSPFQGVNINFTTSLFLGTVTSTGAGTATPTWSTSAPAGYEINGDEFIVSTGGWSVDTSGHIDSGGGTNSWASLTPAGPDGELYWGSAGAGGAIAGSTAGYAGNYVINANGDGTVFRLSCPAGVATFPVWGDSSQELGQMLLVKPNPGVIYQQATGSITAAASSTTWQIVGTASNTSVASGAFTPQTLAGTASNTSSASGTIGQLDSIVGTASNTSSATGALTQIIHLVGTASNVSAATGAITLLAVLAGTASTTSLASGTLSLLMPFAGTASTTSAASGTLGDIIHLVGTASNTSVATGAFVLAEGIAGTASNTSQASGSFLGAGIAGTAANVSSASGVIVLLIPVVGTASNASQGSGSITLLVTLRGTASNGSVATGAIVLQMQFAGTASNVSSATGSFPVTITATAITVSQASGTFGLIVHFVGTASNGSSASGSLTLILTLAGTASNTSTASGTFGATSIVGTAVTTSHASGSVSITSPVAGTASTASHASGSFVILQGLRGTASTASSASGTLRIVLGIRGTAATVSVAMGTIFIGAPPRSPQHLGGTLADESLLAGTFVNVTVIYDGGLVNKNVLGGVVVDGNALAGNVAHTVVLSGTAIVIDTVDSALEEWTMIEVDITLAEFNDETLALAITSGGSPLNITGMTINMFLKTAAGVSDTDPATLKLSTTTGEITIVSPTGGTANVAIPASDLGFGDTNYQFYRVEVVNGGKANTAIFGKVGITPL